MNLYAALYCPTSAGIQGKHDIELYSIIASAADSPGKFLHSSTESGNQIGADAAELPE
jgi:hypothetical protein